MKKYIFLFLGFFIIGCGSITEVSKTLWGSSVRTLNNQRDEAISKSYVCTFDECFDAVLSLDQNNDVLEPQTEKYFDVFLKDRIESHIVVMGIPGQVDTTDAGIFFTPYGTQSYIIEVTSLSTRAKEKVAHAVFAELDLRFQESR